MKRKTEQTIAAFAATGILIGALCGFVAVDLSTELYMPDGGIGPLFQINRIDSEGVSLGLLGREYAIPTESMDAAREAIWEYRGLLPRSMAVSGNLTTRLYVAVKDRIDSAAPPEEPW